MSGISFLDYTFRMHTRGGHTVVFQSARQDTSSATVQYYGWLSDSGAYVIMKYDMTDAANTTMTYYFSKTGVFADDWTGRAALTYVEYNALYT